MKYELKKMNMDMGIAEYEMFQDIPLKENGQTNICASLPYEVFKNYLEMELSREYQNISLYDTKTISYIMYVDDIPVGVISLRLEIDDNWRKWSGNFYYKIRKSMRGKGYGNIILKLAIEEFKKIGYKEIFGQASKNNTISSKVIEYNGGILISEINGTKYYKIELEV